MVKNKSGKPVKKTDKELWAMIEKCISNNDYIIKAHAKKRQIDRSITDIDILDILENKRNRQRKRNKKKDEYADGFFDWKYCIEGLDLDGENKIRIIVSFNEKPDLLVITVIRLNTWE